jgi:uncharacterized protein YdaU (DUF1376 family)
MKKSPAFQLYPQDFLVGTADMTSEEVGGYIRLLCYQWTKGFLENNDKKLMQLSGVFDINDLNNVKSKFILCEDGYLRNGRMESTRLEQDTYREKQASKSKEYWDKKKLVALDRLATPEPIPLGMALDMARVSPSPSPSPSPTTTTTSLPLTTTKDILLKKESKKVLEIILPFDSEEFKTAWKNWKEYKRVEKNFKFKSDISESIALKKLLADCLGRENIALEMIETSISAGWTGLFTPTKKQNYEPIATPEPKKQRTFQDMLDDKAKREGTYVSTEGDNEQFTDFDTVD